jgi:chemotaxis protein MotB
MRRKRHEEYTNHEAWAIPYADLMTLLLAFFVVMYAVSVVNEGKFRVMSESLVQAFNGSGQAITPVPAGHVPARAPVPPLASSKATAGTPLSPINTLIPQRRAPVQAAAGRDGKATELDRIEGQVRKAMQPLIARKLVVVRQGPDRLEVEIRTDILFPSGVAQLSAPANGVLRSLASILAPFGNPLRVEGFTDDVPIKTALYPSNWELSAARAASVARLFAERGVAPTRLGIVGWGEVKPIADNATAEGRNQNRRVLVVVMGQHDAASRPQSDVEHAGEMPGLTRPSAATAQMSPVAQPPPAVAPASVVPLSPAADAVVAQALPAVSASTTTSMPTMVVRAPAPASISVPTPATGDVVGSGQRHGVARGSR